MGPSEKEKLYIKIFDDVFCLMTDDLRLVNYFKKEYSLIKNPNRVKSKIVISKDKSNCFLATNKTTIKLSLEENSLLFYKYVDFVIMTLIAADCIKKRIYFAHGSAFEKNGLGYAFLGPQGAGKSTIIRNIPKKNIYADDTVIIKIDKDKSYIEPSPFDKKHILYNRKIKLLLNKAFILNKSHSNKIKNLTIEEIFQTLIGSDIYTYLFTKIKKEKKFKIKFYQLVFKIIRNTKIDELNFNKKFNPYNNTIYNQK